MKNMAVFDCKMYGQDWEQARKVVSAIQALGFEFPVPKPLDDIMDEIEENADLDKLCYILFIDPASGRFVVVYDMMDSVTEDEYYKGVPVLRHFGELKQSIKQTWSALPRPPKLKREEGSAGSRAPGSGNGAGSMAAKKALSATAE